MRKLIRSVFLSIGTAIKNDSEVQKLLDKHPIICGFIKRRLTPDEAFGLNLTIGSFLTLFFIFFFFKLLKTALGEAEITESDIRILNLVQIFRTPSFTHFMLFMTTLGKWQVIFLGTFAAIIIFFMRQRWYNLTILFMSVGIGELFVWIIKNLIERPRPALVNALTPEAGFSFPSGHAFVAFSFYGLIAYFLFHAVRKVWVKIGILCGAALVILLIAVSRVYLGVHWPSDVFASMFSGIAWLTMLITVLEIRRKVRGMLPAKRFCPWMIRGTACAFFCIWLMAAWYLFYAYTLPPVIAHYQQKETRSVYKGNISNEFFKNLPRYSETMLGTKTEPIHFIFVGSQEDISRALEKAGWVLSEEISFMSFQKLAYAFLFDAPYPNAPGTPTFWDTKPNDFSYEKPTPENSIRERHHIHLWVTPYSTNTGKHIFLGTAHFDNGLKFKSRLIIPVHKIDPAIDKEREYIKKALLETGAIERIDEFSIIEPTLGKNVSGDQFFTDGKAYTVFFKMEQVQ
jgi:undecaprenyl-diphosphatase